ncbi:MAG: DinB family protein [Terriglobales bacterium]
MPTQTQSQLERILDEGYASAEPWHGPNLRQAIAQVPEALAYWRPAPERHSIAEIALHHAFYVHSVRGRIAAAPEPFPVTAEWVALPGSSGPDWKNIQTLLAEQQARLAALAGDLAAGRATSKLSQEETFGTILGITSHAIYHAAQIQLLKRLHG